LNGGKDFQNENIFGKRYILAAVGSFYRNFGWFLGWFLYDVPCKEKFRILTTKRRTSIMQQKQTHFYSSLKSNKLNISGNKNLIKMELFLSFLRDVNLVRINKHLGFINGWTLLEDRELKLIVKGGIINGVEYLESLEFGFHLSNDYNNFVNPFYLKDLLTNNGKVFFLEYYKEDIAKILQEQEKNIQLLEQRLKEESINYKNTLHEINSIKDKIVLK